MGGLVVEPFFHEPLTVLVPGSQVRRLLQRTARRSPPVTEAGWAELWAGLSQLQATAFQQVARPWVLAELCRALMRCGCVVTQRVERER
jgi:hypothetical protein